MDGAGRAAEVAHELDEAWYRTAYPQVAVDLAAGRARGLHEHYETVGRFRGYLPNRRAHRPRNPAAVRSEFGGVWTDQGNALDLVEGKLALGWITPEEADLLRAFITDGYVVLKQAVGGEMLDAAEQALEDAYAGRIEGLKFACPDLGYELGPWDAKVRELPAKALEIHAASPEIREAIFSARLLRFIQLVFERPALATQSLGFYRGSGQNLHQDTAYVTYTLPLQFVASWVALEDVVAGAGELMYRPGSQGLGDFLYDGQFKSLSEAERHRGGGAPELATQANKHVESLVERSDQQGYPRTTFLAKRGDVLVWAADLAHGGMPISERATRKSVVTHYCPADVAPLYFENIPGRRIVPHGPGAAYATFLDYPPEHRPAPVAAATAGPLRRAWAFWRRDRR
jgi:ectoine hydroxylase-related dioxygenase (phytanoyl-CoA dioxygenase family)